MNAVYMGTLEQGDPLYGYMLKDVLPQVEPGIRDPVFHVSRLPASNMVYKYREERTDIAVIGKFYSFARRDKAKRLMSEYENLGRARAIGLSSPPNYVVRPLGRDSSMGLGIMEEYVEGKDLDHYIKGAIYRGRHSRLRERLTELAAFLSELHRRTKTHRPLDMKPSAGYYERLLMKLTERGLLDEESLKKFRRLEREWMEREYMRADREVVIHGDATPTNFLFPKEEGVIAIDLERMRGGDRMFDVGMVCGELKHAFIWRAGDRYASEAHIGHFLHEYSKRSGKDFGLVAKRNPFYMAMTELRIARNAWLDREHRTRLVGEALECLRWGLRLGG